MDLGSTGFDSPGAGLQGATPIGIVPPPVGTDQSGVSFESDTELTEPIPLDYRDDVLRWLEAHPDPPAACYTDYTNAWYTANKQ